MNQIKLYLNCNTLKLSIAVFFCVLSSCSTTKVSESNPYKVKFLDEYILQENLYFNQQEIGGLSGIDIDGSDYYLVSDKARKPSIFKAKIEINNYKIDTVLFDSQISIDCDHIPYFDTESIRRIPNSSNYIVSTEGNIDLGLPPHIIEVNNNGKCIKSYKLPDDILNNHPRNNAVFEGLSIDFEQKGFWVINELPNRKDGKKPMMINTNSPLRITHYNFNSLYPDQQISYDLERLVKLPYLPFGINGATEILQLHKDYMIVLERSFSAGHKSRGNRVKLYLIDLSLAENIIDNKSLKNSKASNVSKMLLFDSNWIKKKLKYNFIDNIEGISFGPNLPNGNKSLILVSDNNFNKIGEQLNQFILLELIPNHDK